MGSTAAKVAMEQLLRRKTFVGEPLVWWDIANPDEA